VVEETLLPLIAEILQEKCLQFSSHLLQLLSQHRIRHGPAAQQGFQNISQRELGLHGPGELGLGGHGDLS
jgi:hypothetical protein